MEFENLIGQGSHFYPIITVIKPWIATGFSVVAASLIGLSFLSRSSLIKLFLFFLAIGFGYFILQSSLGSTAMVGSGEISELQCKRLEDSRPVTSDRLYPALIAQCSGWPIHDPENSWALSLAKFHNGSGEIPLIVGLAALLLYINLGTNFLNGPQMIFRSFLAAALLVVILSYRYELLALANMVVARLQISFFTQFGMVSYDDAMQNLSNSLVQLKYDAENASYFENIGMIDKMFNGLASFSGVFINIYSTTFIAAQRLIVMFMPLIAAMFILSGKFSPLGLIPVIMKVAMLSFMQIPLYLYLATMPDGIEGPLMMGLFSITLFILTLVALWIFKGFIFSFFMSLRNDPMGKIKIGAGQAKRGADWLAR